MAARVCVRNTFLCLHSHTGFRDGRDRAHTEGSLCVQDDCEFTREHVRKLQALLSYEVREQGVQVLQDSGASCQGLGRSLGKVGAVLSNSSVSTMAPSDESGDESTECGEASFSWADSDEENLWQHGPVRPAAPKASKSGLVPKRVNLVEGYAKSRKEGQAVTTVMIRNIPNRCGQRELIAELEAAGFQGCFDFLYIPLDLGTMSNVGYACEFHAPCARHPMHASIAKAPVQEATKSWQGRGCAAGAHARTGGQLATLRESRREHVSLAPEASSCDERLQRRGFVCLIF